MARGRVQPAASLAGLISDPTDEAMSDEILGEAPDSNQENFMPGRALAQKPRSMATNYRGGRSAVTKKGNISKPRTNIMRKPTRKEMEEEDEVDEDVDELDDMDELMIPESRPTVAQRSKARPVAKAKAASVDRTEELAHYKAPVRQSPRKAAKVNGTKQVQPQAFYELQSDGVEGDALGSEANMLIEELAPPVPQYQPLAAQARTTSQQPGSMLLNRQRRAGSTSSNEGKNPDPALRRRLGEMTKKFEALEIRYRKLHEVGVEDAKKNFDTLKTSSDEKARISNDLINALKKELASQKAQSQSSHSRMQDIESHQATIRDMQAQLAAAKKEISELKTERSELKTELTNSKAEVKAHAPIAKQLAESKINSASLSKQLAEARTEQSNLQAKLAAARNVSVDRQAPGSAMKGIKVPVMKVMTTTAEAAAAVQEAQSKVDLYSDLTGLLINRVEKRPGEQLDIFDCIQTGRNGTLHFKLSVSTDTAEAYNEAEMAYLPQLDGARDKALMDILPYYLAEDITFPRQEAAKFYSRVFETLTRRFEDAQAEEEEEDE